MNGFENILIFDTALQGCAVAAVKGEAYEVSFRDEPYGQAEHLMPMIEAVLSKLSLAYSDLDAVITTLGPGAFTGLRIGLSTAKALGLSLDIPVYGVSTTQALALRYVSHRAEPCTVLIESKRADLYMQSFDATAMPREAAYTALPDAIPNDGHVFIGDAVQRYVEAVDDEILVNDEHDRIDPVLLVRCFQEKPDLFTQDLEPLYLRGADVSQPKKQPRKLASF